MSRVMFALLQRPQMGGWKQQEVLFSFSFLFFNLSSLHSAEDCLGLKGGPDQPSELLQIMHNRVHA